MPTTGTVNLDELQSPNREAFWEPEDRRYLIDRALTVMRAEFQPTTWKACWGMMNGQSAEEIGTELGLRPEAVRAAKYRVVNRLRREMEKLLD